MTTPSASDSRAPHPAWRAFWGILVALLIVAETGALRRALIGDTLSETVWWLYGDPFGLRWWLLGCTVGALLTWAGLHFMWAPVAARALIGFEVVALGVAAAGWLLTR
jgi:hypothetical protein